MQQKLNCYTCSEGHKTITVDTDSGVTPMFIECPTCIEEFKTVKSAQSSFYRVHQSHQPIWEWYRPTGELLKIMSDSMIEHVENGGLTLRRISDKLDFEDFIKLHFEKTDGTPPNVEPVRPNPDPHRGDLLTVPNDLITAKIYDHDIYFRGFKLPADLVCAWSLSMICDLLGENELYLYKD